MNNDQGQADQASEDVVVACLIRSPLPLVLMAGPQRKLPATIRWHKRRRFLRNLGTERKKARRARSLPSSSPSTKPWRVTALPSTERGKAGSISRPIPEASLELTL